MLKVKAIPLWSDPNRSCSRVSQDINLEIRLEEHKEEYMKDEALVETNVGEVNLLVYDVEVICYCKMFDEFASST